MANLKEENNETALDLNEVLSCMEDNIGEPGYECLYAEAAPLLKSVTMLRAQNDLRWIEEAAKYYACCSHLSFLEEEWKKEYNLMANYLYAWMVEESRYLQIVYPDHIKEKREEITEVIENIEAARYAKGYLCGSESGLFLRSVLKKLKASNYLLNTRHTIKLLKYLLCYEHTIYTQQLAEIIEIIYLIKCNNLADEELNQSLEEVFIQKAAEYEKEIASLWFCNEQQELESRITLATRLTTLVLLTARNSEKSSTAQTDKRVLSARICRYLSRLDTPYSTQLKNKAYTMLTGESTLDERISWYELLNFGLNHFIAQIVNIRIEELNVPLEIQEDKWEQYSNEHNTLTLDKDGFTLSPLFPHAVHSWKGRKDKASFMDNRVFIASFSKLTYPFTTCKNITDFQLYWHQLSEDYPLYHNILLQSGTTNKMLDEKQSEETKKTPEPNEEITIGIIGIDPTKQFLEGVILDDAYRGQKAILPLTQINACYFMIEGFEKFFSTNDTYKVRVVEKNAEGIRVSLAQSYNEFIYAENCQRKRMPAMITDCEGNKIKWLLITGSTSVTPTNRWIKPKVGDIYQVEFQEANGRTMKPIISVEKLKANISTEEFYKEVTRHIIEFVSQLSQHLLINRERKNTEQKLKDKNNPFIAALQKLNFEKVGIAEDLETTETYDEETDTSSVSPTPKTGHMDMSVAEELIYCLDQLSKDLTEPCEQFNAYNFLHLLCLFCGKEKEAMYYELCAAYLYNVNLLTTLPFKERFSSETLQRFNILLARMEQLGIQKYGISFEFTKNIIHILCSIHKPDSNLPTLLHHEDKTISNLARYFSMLTLVADNDFELLSIIYKNINELLGFKEAEKKTVSSVPVYFGHEGVEREFKSSAFIHPDKDTDEDQSVALARVIASFMNTDGGTLYIGVNDNGYLIGIQQDMKFVHNDCDIYLRTVNKRIIRLLGEGKEDGNRYQEYIRCNFHEYNNQRRVLAFRVAPVREVVKVNGNVYTRSGSSCICKPEQNIAEFAAMRRTLPLDSTPRKPEFPTFFSEEKEEYIFDPTISESGHATPSLFEGEETVEVSTVTPTPLPPAPSKKKGASFSIFTSTLRPNPLQKKVELGYRNSYRFISLFNNGKIACSPSPKIGVWGEEGGKVFCSYDTEGDEDLLITVFTTGEVGISNLSKGFSSTNSPTAFINNVNNLLFCSPASKDKYLLVIAEKDDTKRYRIIRLSDFEKPLGLQPKLTTLLIPEKGTYIFAEILDEKIVKTIDDDKVSLTSFDQYNAGRFWEHTSYKSGLETISKLCNLPY